MKYRGGPGILIFFSLTQKGGAEGLVITVFTFELSEKKLKYIYCEEEWNVNHYGRLILYIEPSGPPLF